MKLDKMGNKTFESGTDKNKIVTTVMAVNSGIDSGNNGGSVKDRMALWNKKKVVKKEEKTNDANAENERLRLQKEKADKLKKEKEQREKYEKMQREKQQKEDAEKLRKEKAEK